MKSSLSFKASERHQRTSRSLSRQDSGPRESNGVQVVREPTMHHGKMCATPFKETEARSVRGLVDVVLCISGDSVHAVTEEQHEIAFQSPIAAMKEVVWDHSEKSVYFLLDDGSVSPVFIFPVLTEVETQLRAVLATPELQKAPSQVYMGVFIGQNLPSPIQQRRMSLTDKRQGALPMPECRELLRREQPARNAIGRERLGVEYMRSGCLFFTCSINGDLRGLNLDVHHVRVFPSPDCHDRSACLFSYMYESLESCEVTGTRVELRFRMEQERVKQPEYLAFQSLEAQRIREAIWYLKHGTYVDDWLRQGLASKRPSSPPFFVGFGRRASALTFFADKDSLKQRIDACCRVIGCQHRVDSSEQSGRLASEISASNMTIHINSGTQSHVAPAIKATPSISRMVTSSLCDQHISLIASQPRSPSKRGSFFSRDKSSFTEKSGKLLLTLLQSSHYMKMFKYQGHLLKRQSDHKFQLKKAWKMKLTVLFETPVGGFLCYYDRVAHVPGMTEDPKERRVIDLSSVICIRPVSTSTSAHNGGSSTNSPTSLAFDVVTLYRTWTFAATDSEEYEIWLNVLAEAVEKHASIAPDKPLRFPIKLARTDQSSPIDATTLEISSYGVCLCTGADDEVELGMWYFTELEKWSIVQQQHYMCCLLSCRSPPAVIGHSSHTVRPDPAQSGLTQQYLLQTSEASAICLAIEFYVGKCMAKIEVLTAQYWEKKSTKHAAHSIITASSSAPKLGLPPKKSHLVNGISLAPIGVPTSASHERSSSLLPAVPEGAAALDDGNDSTPSILDGVHLSKSDELCLRTPELSSTEKAPGSVQMRKGVTPTLFHYGESDDSQPVALGDISSGAPLDDGEPSLVTLNDINLEWGPEDEISSIQEGVQWLPADGDYPAASAARHQEVVTLDGPRREDIEKEHESEPAVIRACADTKPSDANSTHQEASTSETHGTETESASGSGIQEEQTQRTNLELMWPDFTFQELDSCLPSPVPIMEERSSSLMPLLELRTSFSTIPLPQNELNSPPDQEKREDAEDRRSTHEPSEPSEAFDSCISEVDFLKSEGNEEASDCGVRGSPSFGPEEEQNASCAGSDDDQFEDAIDPGVLLDLNKQKVTLFSD